MAKITGIIDLKINGALQRTKEKSTSLETGGFTREAVKGGRRVHGFTETVQESVLETTLVHASDFDVKELNEMVDATVEVITDTGLTYIMANAFTSEPVKIEENGEASLKMMGDAVEEG